MGTFPDFVANGAPHANAVNSDWIEGRALRKSTKQPSETEDKNGRKTKANKVMDLGSILAPLWVSPIDGHTDALQGRPLPQRGMQALDFAPTSLALPTSLTTLNALLVIRRRISSELRQDCYQLSTITHLIGLFGSAIVNRKTIPPTPDFG